MPGYEAQRRGWGFEGQRNAAANEGAAGSAIRLRCVPIGLLSCPEVCGNRCCRASVWPARLLRSVETRTTYRAGQLVQDAGGGWSVWSPCNAGQKKDEGCGDVWEGHDAFLSAR